MNLTFSVSGSDFFLSASFLLVLGIVLLLGAFRASPLLMAAAAAR